MLTTNEILTFLYSVIVASPINALGGGVYKKTRPTDSILEDCVISIIPGTSAKFVQDGAIYVKIFYLDINQDNTYYEDAATGQAMEILLRNLSESLLHLYNISFDVQSREIYTEAVPEIHQHYAILKINFKVI